MIELVFSVTVSLEMGIWVPVASQPFMCPLANTEFAGIVIINATDNFTAIFIAGTTGCATVVPDGEFRQVNSIGISEERT